MMCWYMANILKIIVRNIVLAAINSKTYLCNCPILIRISVNWIICTEDKDILANFFIKQSSSSSRKIMLFQGSFHKFEN